MIYSHFAGLIETDPREESGVYIDINFKLKDSASYARITTSDTKTPHVPLPRNWIFVPWDFS